MEKLISSENQDNEEQKFREGLNSNELKEYNYIETLKSLSEDLCEIMESAMADISLSNIIDQIEEDFLDLVAKGDDIRITNRQIPTVVKSKNKGFEKLETKIEKIKENLSQMLTVIEIRKGDNQMTLNAGSKETIIDKQIPKSELNQQTPKNELVSNLNNDCPRAIIREINGKIVLDDPDVLALIKAIGKTNCEKTLELNRDRIQHFKNRISDKGLTTKDVVIVILNVDDKNGEDIAEILMPNYNRQEIRDRGETPFARGLTTREGMEKIISYLDKEAETKLKQMEGIAVVVVDHNVVEIFEA